MLSSSALYLGFLGALTAERLVELGLSTRNARRARERGGLEVGQAHYRAMVVIHGLFLFACAAEVALLHRAFQPVVGTLALTGAVAAQALRYWAIATLGEAWNTRIIVVPGTPPVVAGPYRYLRHPNYVAVGLELLCVPLVHGAYLTAAVFSVANVLLLAVRIPAEERALGAAYAQAFLDKPRFLPELNRGHSH